MSKSMCAVVIGMGVVIAACKGSGGGGAGAEYKHSSPKFKVSIPAGLVQGKVKDEGDSANLSFASKDYSREVFLLWAKTGSQFDPQNNWATYGKEADSKQVLGEGKLPGNAGNWIENDRGRTYIHAVMTTSDGYGVLCMASSAPGKPDRELLDACKTLAPY